MRDGPARAGFGPVLWAIARNQLRTWYELYPACINKNLPCIHVPMTVYPHACGHVSACRWPCIHVVVYLLAHGRRLDTHAEFGYAAWASAKSLVMRYGQWSESGYALWVSAQNLVMCRIIGESTESHKIRSIACCILKRNRHGINCTSKGLYYPCLKPPTRLENILILRCGPLCTMPIELNYRGKYEVEFETVFGVQNRGPGGIFR